MTHGIRPETAESGVEAIAKIQKKDYDLVFMDHMMPGMDGIEATRRIRAWEAKPARGKTKREARRPIPIVALTANAAGGARELFLAAGMNDFISKPIDPAELNRILKKWLPVDGSVEARPETPSPGATRPGRPAPPAPAAAHTSLNRESALHNIGGSEELYRQLLETFREDHSDDYEKIDAAITEGDLTLAHRIAHTLKSTAGLIGAEGLRQICYRAETALKKKDSEAALKELPALKDELTLVLRFPALPPS
jgi:CheY-like chemotaxis protein